MAVTIAAVNELIPVHSMWDGFWINDFSDNTLIISCSFNRLYYRDFDITFHGVSFFNIPYEWRDTDVPGEHLFREATISEFSPLFPEIDCHSKLIIAINLYFRPWQQEPVHHTFYIVCDSVSAMQCVPGHSCPGANYIEPLEEEPFPSKKNRVPFLCK
jgi:hypothetical protein